jgi:hypothetical protein
MADPASILGLVSASVSIANGIYLYTSSFQNAPKCAAGLGAEVKDVYVSRSRLQSFAKRLKHRKN